jgi:transcriptional regulator with XRE-family HTH domain
VAKGFGARVRSLRHEQGLTQEQLAESAGITANNLQLVENGGSNPTLATISALARSLKITISELFSAVEAKAARR